MTALHIAIPETTPVRLTPLQRSALAFLLRSGPPDFEFDELLRLVLLKGLSVLLKGRELPSIWEDFSAEAEASQSFPCTLPLRSDPRVVHEWLGFAIEEHHDQGLDELAARHPLVDEDELCRIVFGAGLRALPTDETAQIFLKAAANSEAEGGQP